MKFGEHSVVELEPLISPAQRSFIDGDLSADAYVMMGQEEAEKEVENELAHQRHRQLRRLLVVFSVAGAAIYVAVAFVFFLIDKNNLGSIAAAVSSVLLAAIAFAASVAGRSTRRS